MQASIYEEYGNPEVLQIKEVPKPIPKENEILVKVKATTVNRTDCAMLTAKPFIMRFLTGLVKPKNPILGTDFAGAIEAVGEAVSKFKVGDKVFGFDDMGVSSQARYLTISTTKAISTIPENISFEQAAASIEGMHYAYNFINKVNFQAGQKVLINGATGAIGSAMLQLILYFGGVVTAVCNTKNIDLIKKLGAKKVIDYEKEDFTKTPEKYDYVFDAVGKSTFGQCKSLLSPKGIYISSELGPGAQNLFYSLFTPLFGGKKVVFPFPHKIPESLGLVKKMMVNQKFKPVIDRTYPLEQIADAYRYVLTGQKTGNVVITYENVNL